MVVVLDTAEELLDAKELSELELATLELTRLEPAVLELITLALLRLIEELLVVVTGGLVLVLPVPPPQAVRIKLRKLTIKTWLINLIVVSGIQVAPFIIMLLAKSETDCCKRLHLYYIETYVAQLA